MRMPMPAYFFLLVTVGDGLLAMLRSNGNGRNRMLPLSVSVMILCVTSLAPMSDTVDTMRTMMSGRLFSQYNQSLTVFITVFDQVQLEYMTPITPLKQSLLRPMEICEPD